MIDTDDSYHYFKNLEKIFQKFKLNSNLIKTYKQTNLLARYSK